MGNPTHFPPLQADLLAVIGATVQTVGNTTAAILDWSSPVSASITVEICLQGDESPAGGNAYSYVRVATIKNNGTVSSLQGALASVHTAEASTSADISVTFPGGSTVRVNAVGATGRTINWHTCTIRRKGV